jgi:hypothetical protein
MAVAGPSGEKNKFATNTLYVPAKGNPRQLYYPAQDAEKTANLPPPLQPSAKEKFRRHCGKYWRIHLLIFIVMNIFFTLLR